MWPYATRGSRFMGDVSEISPSALEAEDFSANAVSIKLWLPAKLVAAIDVLCDQRDAAGLTCCAGFSSSTCSVEWNSLICSRFRPRTRTELMGRSR